MGMTITEKIMADSAGKEYVLPGENIWLNVDILLTHDVCGPPTIQIWKDRFGDNARIWDKNKLVIFPDHYIYTKNPQALRNIDILRTFAKDQELPHYYDPSTKEYKGVCHIAMADSGFNRPGTVIFGTDSHTCTAGAFGLFSTGVGNTDAAFIMGTGKIWEKVPESIKIILDGKMPEYLTAKDIILRIIGDIGVDGANYMAMEFTGEAVSSMDMYERMTLTNMAIEAGAINGIIACDEVTIKFMEKFNDKEFKVFTSDEDAVYKKVLQYNVESLKPMLARPHSPDNKSEVTESEKTKITKAYIGSCTGGKITDFEFAAKILYGNTVAVPTFIVPGSPQIKNQLKQLLFNKKSYEDIFRDAGCIITESSCAACLGGPEDTVGRAVDFDTVISTTNRNFPGRMGSKKAEVYLASPLTVAASAIYGEITDPETLQENENEKYY